MIPPSLSINPEERPPHRICFIPRSQPDSPGDRRPFQKAEDQVKKDGQEGGGNRSRQDQIVPVHAQPPVDQITEAAGTDEGGQGDQTHGKDGGGADAGHDDGKGEGQFLNRICREVIPIPRPASTMAGSTRRMPA